MTTIVLTVCGVVVLVAGAVLTRRRLTARSAGSAVDGDRAEAAADYVATFMVTMYFQFLHGKLVPRGRLLNHCITRPSNLPLARYTGMCR